MGERAIRAALGFLVASISVTTLAGQRGGGAQQPTSLPATPVVAPIPTVSAPITGPGPMFESLMELKPGDDLAHFGYESAEYFVSGVSNGGPYKTRLVIRRPSDTKRVSGLVLAESMHPSGNAWMFHFTHTYSMTAGHVGLDILTSTQAPLVEFNHARYGDLRVAQGQANDILAQVGALIKSGEPGNPLAGVPIRKMILGGTSASAAVLINYLPAHMVYTLRGGAPIFDAFLPTSTGATIGQVKVPMIQVPTMTEVASGNATTRQDGDEPGNQFRGYEFAGMAHIDTRDAAAYYPDPCKHPISRFPLAAYMSVALDYLWKWADKGIAPPRADRILVDRNADNDGSLMALDEVGNARGGIRNPYVDVPAKSYAVRNEGASPPIANAHRFVAVRDAAGRNQLCGLAGFERALPAQELRRLYGSPQKYRARVAQRLEELTRSGWSLPVYKDVILADLAAVEF
ncbi:MAG TPA: alpha/beta hydrolase domain-containing protein [Vicinamibacterales bacterium]|nr:alpha/beta hydrolase domain-containing protein [Vicinamibacterales bacterium]